MSILTKELTEDITTRYAMLYALLCRTNESTISIGGPNIELPPTTKGFKEFIEWLFEITEPKEWMKVVIDNIDYSLITEQSLNKIYKSNFRWLNRMRMTNSYHSRLNSGKRNVTVGAFYPVEGFKTLELLNLPGVFNMHDLIFKKSQKHINSLNWFINSPNRIMIDNGAFTAQNLTTADHGDILNWYRGLYQRTKYISGYRTEQQGEVMRSALYQKLLIVAPDEPQNAPRTFSLLKRFAPIIKQATAQIDTLYAIQIVNKKPKLIDKMLNIISGMGINSIIGIPVANQELRTKAFSRIPYIVSKAEKILTGAIPSPLYCASMNNILSYTCSDIQITPNLKGTKNVFRYHLLGSSFGPQYQNLLLNICVCSMLVKEMGIASQNFNNDALGEFKKIKDLKKRVLILGKEYHPEVYRHIVSCDSSSWLSAGNNGNSYEPFSGTQYPIKKYSWLSDAKNIEIKRNLAVTASKIAEANYYTTFPRANSEFNKQVALQIEDSFSLFKKETEILNSMTQQEQNKAREDFKNKVLRQGNWK